MKDAIRYTITIEATIEREEKSGRELKPVSNEPGAKMDYTPEVQKTVIRNVDVFKQQVDALDVTKVIAAINGINVAP